jgi:chromosome segregation ATPase
MDTALTAETQLLQDIEALRARYPNTQDLYREVCTVMFFRYGVTPTANRLYQLVRKGSMSAPADALNRFWQQLRERSRVTIDSPDLPESLKAGAGDLLATLWKQAQLEAEAGFIAHRDESLARITAAEESAREAAVRAESLAQQLDHELAAHAQARTGNAALQQELRTAEALLAKARERLDEARRELNEQHAWFKTVERDHAAAIDKLRDQLKADHNAAEAAQRHLSQEVERERSAAARLQHALDTEHVAAGNAADRHRAELRDTLAEIATLRQRLGTLEGNAATVAAARDHAMLQLADSQRDLAKAHAEAAAATGRAAALETALRQGASPASAPRPRRPKGAPEA